MGRRYYSDYDSALLWPYMLKALIINAVVFAGSVFLPAFITANLVAVPLVFGATLITSVVMLIWSVVTDFEIELPPKKEKIYKPKGWRKIEREARRQKYVKDLEKKLDMEIIL